MGVNPYIVTLICTWLILSSTFIVFWFNPPMEIDSKLIKTVSTSSVVSLFVIIFISIFVNFFSLKMILEKTKEANQIETIRQYQGVSINKLSEKENYEMNYLITKIIHDSNNLYKIKLILSTETSAPRYYEFFSNRVRKKDKTFFQSNEEFPKFFKAKLESFLEKSPSGEKLEETEAWILYPLDSF